MHDSDTFVSDDDKYGHDFIGEARIPLFHLKPQEPRHMNIYLEKHCPVTYLSWDCITVTVMKLTKLCFCKWMEKVEEYYSRFIFLKI
jgi:hypothetical protein